MTNQEIIEYLPNPEHLRDVVQLLRDSNPQPGAWNTWEINVRVMSVWADRLDELIEKLSIGY